MEQWEKNYYISAIAGANNGNSLVVMSKGKSSIIEIIILQAVYLGWQLWAGLL